jgi:uncharacterized protein
VIDLPHPLFKSYLCLFLYVISLIPYLYGLLRLAAAFFNRTFFNLSSFWLKFGIGFCMCMGIAWGGLFMWILLPFQQGYILFIPVGALILYGVYDFIRFCQTSYKPYPDFVQNKPLLKAYFPHTEIVQGKYNKQYPMLLSRQNEIYQLYLHEIQVFHAKLPPCWDGLRVLLLSDLHFGRGVLYPYYDWLLEQIDKTCTYDLIVLPGDFVAFPEHYQAFIDWTMLLKANLGIYMCLGNHDFWCTEKAYHRGFKHPEQYEFRNLPEHVTVLRNTSQIISSPSMSASLGIAGIDYSYLPNTKVITQVSAPLRDIPFRILLSHSPDHFRAARAQDFHLTLSGHTHGGQIRLPGFGSVVVPSIKGRRFDRGVFGSSDDTVLVVSQGIGCSFPFRYHCSPEAIQLVLRSGRNKSYEKP